MDENRSCKWKIRLTGGNGLMDEKSDLWMEKSGLLVEIGLMDENRP